MSVIKRCNIMSTVFLHNCKPFFALNVSYTKWYNILYFRDQTSQLFHHMIYCGYYSWAATNQRAVFIKLSMNKEARKRIGAPCMHKEASATCGTIIIIPTKWLEITKAITVAKEFTSHTSRTPVPQPQEMQDSSWGT